MPFQKHQDKTTREEECAYWLIFVPFSILWPQMGRKSPLQRDSIGVWPKLHYVDTVHIKRLPNPARAFFETTEAAQQDLHIFAKLKFFMAVCWSFSSLLTKLQQINKGCHSLQILPELLRKTYLSHSVPLILSIKYTNIIINKVCSHCVSGFTSFSSESVKNLRHGVYSKQFNFSWIHAVTIWITDG